MVVFVSLLRNVIFNLMSTFSITDGATLKLVLAMRGGPINTRRSKCAPNL